MPKMHVEKSILINSSPESIFELLSNMEKWSGWSPWLIMEPEAEVKVADDKRSYSWEGDRIGSGSMKIIGEKHPNSIDYDLEFIKPWRSKAKVNFSIEAQGNETKVSWSMDSSLPFFLFWMKKMMEGFVGMDFQRGLFLLKDLVEDGEVHSKLVFAGIEEYEGCEYVGIRKETTMEKVGSDMSKDFDRLNEWAKENKDRLTGNPFSIYHKWDMKNGKVAYTSGFPIKEASESIPEGFVTGNIPKTKVNTVEHIGPYKHLGNAWGTQYSMQRSKAFKQNKKIHPFETYRNMPGEVPDNELHTRIHFPVR